MTLRLLCLAALVLPVACAPAPLRVAVPPVTVAERIPSAFATVELLDVSLPAYAETDDIFVQDEGGALRRLGRTRWADEPARAFTLDLAQALADLTGARVAPEPWPFEDRAAARVDVRLSEAVADRARGEYVLRGQIFVAAQDGTGRDRAGAFRIAVPLPPDPGPAAIAAARAGATLMLAQEIAAKGLR
ncbi:hypothetical protein ruthe_01216 [Rubellimicrobium thermophilum DSM 16684]|uniref:ABC-type transport auxiliary lipoprotein component domain-containing protein n=1 Tax=Rubellimicrobium thermophilum DSM 16684 TaxID=1123069 RepID=S9QYC9_9RHOB|nr:ABC-type transport auxiliary lipoprotein family protein [Rubellimicrobium thermophilum]EPX86401.1 hypothetical protein ruthe_01216 [Rubellimicrobium thermophilum DSM 16684]